MRHSPARIRMQSLARTCGRQGTLMIGEDIRELKTGRRELRRFGLLVGGVFIVLGTLAWRRDRAWFPWLLAPGILLVVAGILVPRSLKLIYLAWMTLAIALGLVVSTVLLTLFFFFVITPVGLVARLTGQDFLRLKLDRKISSYWTARKRADRSKTEYERQF